MKIRADISDDEAVQVKKKLFELEIERLQNLSLLWDEEEKMNSSEDTIRKRKKKLKKDKRKSVKDGKVVKRKSSVNVSNNLENIVKIENSFSDVPYNELQTSSNQEKTNKRDSKSTIKKFDGVDTISQNRLALAGELLGDVTTKKKNVLPAEKRLGTFKKFCNTSNLNANCPEDVWESGSFIIKNIRSCILTRDWNNVTHMLLFLLQHNRKQFIKQVAKLNFMKNPADIGEECLQEFYEYFDKTRNDLTFEL